MAKTREAKAKLIDKLDQQVANMKSAVIVEYRGLKVKDIEALRNLLREKKVEFNVTKNTLVRIALRKHNVEFDEEAMKRPVAIAFAMEDEVSSAKEITLFAKKNEAVKILGGILESKAISVEAVKQLASLPTREQLLAQVVGTISAPLTGFVNVMGGNVRGLVNVMNALKEKKA